MLPFLSTCFPRWPPLPGREAKGLNVWDYRLALSSAPMCSAGGSISLLCDQTRPPALLATGRAALPLTSCLCARWAVRLLSCCLHTPQVIWAAIFACLPSTGPRPVQLEGRLRFLLHLPVETRPSPFSPLWACSPLQVLGHQKTVCSLFLPLARSASALIISSPSKPSSIRTPGSPL